MEGALDTLSYVPDFVSEHEEAQLLREVRAAKFKWTQVSGRRLQSYGGSVHGSRGLLQVPLPAWLASLGTRMAQCTAAYGVKPDGGPLEPNHVLVNAYSPGQGIMPHQDGPAYFPGVCILSLGAAAVMRFRQKPGDDSGAESGATSRDGVVASVLLESRSLLVFRDSAYTRYLHGIDEAESEVLDVTVCNLEVCGVQQGHVVARDRERVSLTVRRVERVMPNLLRL